MTKSPSNNGPIDDDRKYFMLVTKEQFSKVDDYFLNCKEEDLKPGAMFAFKIVDTGYDSKGNLQIGFRLQKINPVNKPKIWTPR